MNKPCALCREPIDLLQESQLCAACEPSNVMVLDTETELIRPGLQAPPLVCVSWSDKHDVGLLHHTESREYVEGVLSGDAVIAGHNVAFDMAVFAAKWPDLLPLIFEVYAADRVTCTMLRDQLIHLGLGVMNGFAKSDGSWVHLGYSLEEVSSHRRGPKLEKGTWQLRFGELMDVPLAFWPEEAREYAMLDAVATYHVYERQEQDPQYLEDQFRQARAGWWLQLMSCWGLTTDPEGVREFARLTQQKYDALAQELVSAGLMRLDKKTGRPGTRNVSAVKERVERAYQKLGKQVEMTKGGKKEIPQVKTDADVCERSGDPVLEKYAEFSSLKKTLSTDIPLLEKGVVTPIQTHFTVLLETGRTSSSPNVQNLPTEMGMRECFVPRPGYVYASADYSQFELRTWSQVCLIVLGQSKMAEALNAGNDPHLELARRILGISYEEARDDYKRDPKGKVYFPRQASKSGNFGFPGGLGVKRFVDYARKNYGVVLFATANEARENGAPVSAEELREFWYESWPEARLYFDWMDSQCQVAVPVIKQLFSNRYRGNVSFTEGTNGMFQSLAADAAKAAGFLVARACYVDEGSPLFGSRPVNFVHDEFVVETLDRPEAADAAEELARLMVVGASPFLPDVPPVVEPLLARRWSKAAKPVRSCSQHSSCPVDCKEGRLIPWDLPRRT